MSDATTSKCGACCHCHNGIDYEKWYFLCLHCNLMICSGCTSKHPSDHRQGLRRFKDRMLDVNQKPFGAKCTECKGEAEIRMQCNSCDVKVCQGCWNKCYGKYLEHEHKAFTCLRVPGDVSLPHYDWECGSCELSSSMSHCSRCYEGIMEGERIYECLGCLKDFSESFGVCEACYPIVKKEHPNPAHEWYSVVFREMKNVDSKHAGAKCNECNEKTGLALETKLAHPHREYAIEMGWFERERRTYQSARQCPRRSPKELPPREPVENDNPQCQVCMVKFPLLAQAHLCLECDTLFCRSCKSTGRTMNHPHRFTPVRLRRPTPPDNWWESVAHDEHIKSCSCCEEKIAYECQFHLRCTQCMNYYICRKCMQGESGAKVTVKHACDEWREFIVVDPKFLGQEWVDAQLEKADAFIAKTQEKQAMEEAKAREDEAKERETREREAREREAKEKAAKEREAKEKAVAEATDSQKVLGCTSCHRTFYAKSYFYLCLRCGGEICFSCRPEHTHYVFKVETQVTTPSNEVWRHVVDDTGRRSCDQCKSTFIHELEKHLRCTKCNDYDICTDCIFKKDARFKHACGDWPHYNMFDPKEMGDAWIEDQMAKVDAERAARQAAEDQKVREAEERAAQEEREREAAYRAAQEEARREQEETARKIKEAEETRRVFQENMRMAEELNRKFASLNNLDTPKFTAQAAQRINRAPSPAPRLAPPRQAPVRKQKSSSGLGGLFKGALQLGNAILNAENGGGGGGGGFGGGFVVPQPMPQMNWQPINDAASMPIQ